MAAPKSSLTGRLQKLEAAQARADKVKRGTRLSAKPMAELLGVTWTSLKDWCDEIAKLESSGAVVRGGNGVEWSFEPKRTVKILIDHFRRLEAKEEKESREVIASVGARASGNPGNLTTIKTKVDLTITLANARYKQGEFAKVARFNRVQRRLFEAWARGVLSTRTAIDPTGTLPPHVARAIDEYSLRQIASGQMALEEELEKLSADPWGEGD